MSDLRYLEKEDVPFVLDKKSFKLFKANGVSPEDWREITDSDSFARIFTSSSEISKSDWEELVKMEMAFARSQEEG